MSKIFWTALSYQKSARPLRLLVQLVPHVHQSVDRRRQLNQKTNHHIRPRGQMLGMRP